MTRLFGTAAALAFALAAGCGGAARKYPSEGPSAAPDFALLDASGKTVRLADFRGKPVLVDFWATWCDPCRASIPAYEGLNEKYRAAGLVVLGVDEDDGASAARAFAASHGMKYPVLLDRRRRVYSAFGVRDLPTAFLVGADGRVRGRWSGFDETTAADEERAIASLLAAPAGK